jgi:hypothetical protein
MRTLIVAGLAVFLAGCAVKMPGAVKLENPWPTRELSLSEKTALAGSLPQTMKDPAAAQFKWLPVVLNESPEIKKGNTLTAVS